MKNKKTKYAALFFTIYIFIFVFPLHAFGWPQLADSVAVFFAQKHGDTFNKGLIFNNPAEVKAADSGEVLINIQSEADITGMSRFPSALGDAVIISHKDQILTVYGCLEKNSADDGSGRVENAAIIGISGVSGWKKDSQSLQFQVIDTKIKAVINPLILMDSPVLAKKFVIKNIRAVHKNGESIVLTNGVNIGAGTYTLYMDSNSGTMPYTTNLSINGALIEKTDYTALKTYLKKLCIQGEKHYPFSAMYSNKDSIRLAETTFAKGKNTIDISVKDIGMHETSFHITVTVF